MSDQITEQKISWTDSICMGETGNSYTILVAKPKGRDLFRNLVAVRKKILKHILREQGIQIVKATVQWQVLVRTVVKFQAPYKRWNFLTS